MIDAKLKELEAQADKSIVLISGKDLSAYSLNYGDGVVVIMPSTDVEKAWHTARIMHRRAGMSCMIIIVHDIQREGFIKIVNKTAEKIHCKYVVYVAQDAFPGRNWLKYAYKSLEENQKALLAFNDGKWTGRIASFGMVLKSWTKKLYKKGVFYSGYRSHGADNELTVIARATNMYIYDPESTLIEVDDKKDFAGSNEFDKTLFNERYVNGFGGLVAAESLRNLSEDYRVPAHYYEAVVPKKLQTTKYTYNHPRFITKPFDWVLHTPFAFYLIEKIKPNVFVEIGTINGNSYFSFCQAIQDLNVKTKCYAISTLDVSKDNELTSRVKAINKKEFDKFSTIQHLSSGIALNYHSDKSIDLLHIDNIDSYDLIKECFLSWLPKMSPKGVILIHNTNDKEHDKGVWLFFEEIKKNYPVFEFIFGKGLGVVCVGKNVDFRFVELVNEANHSLFIADFFEKLGSSVLHKIQYLNSEQDIKQKKQTINALKKEIENKEADIKQKQNDIERLKSILSEKEKETKKQELKYKELEQETKSNLKHIIEISNELIATKSIIEKANKEATIYIQRIEQKNHKLANQKSIIGSLKLEIEKIAEKNKKVELSLREIAKEKLQLKQELIQIKSSNIWQITKPVRSLKHKFNQHKSGLLWPLYMFKALLSASKSKISREFNFFKYKRLLENSKLFDTNYYLKTYPDVAGTGNNPIAHYLRRGVHEGRNPSAEFSTSDYLKHNKDVSKSGINPLIHYIKWGKKEGRKKFKAINGEEKLNDYQDYWFNPVKKSKDTKEAEKRVKHLRHKLFNLGFTRKALEELEELTKQPQTNPYLKRFAVRELALWYANKRTAQDANTAINHLQLFKKLEKDPVKLRMGAIIEAECLNRINSNQKAKTLIAKALKKEKHADLYFAAANLEHDLNKKIAWINKAMALHSLSGITIKDHNEREDLYSCLSGSNVPKKIAPLPESAPLVTVIIPAYNAENTIHLVLDAILTQTYSKLEVLVSDDCSEDNTIEIVKEYEQKDARVKLIQAKTNSGPYVARNIALREASGEFVNVNDADDWSHPEKIEKQLDHLLQNPEVIANTSQLVRVFPDLTFFRRGNYGTYLIKNYSSLLFRREKVVKELGYWDSVRFGADADLIERVAKLFGVKNLKCGPLLFAKQTENSLTGNDSFGVHGFLMGARKEYTDARHYHHESAKSLYYSFPQRKRPFAVPEPLWPKRMVKEGKRRHFDVIIASDFRLPGGTTMSNIEEIKAQKDHGMRTGLIQLSRYDLNPHIPINPNIRDLLDGDLVQMLVFGENVSCELLTMRYPPILQEFQRFIPDVEAKQVRVIVNQPPMSDYGPEGELRYQIGACNDRVREYFGKVPIWHPIGPMVRKALASYHPEDLNEVNYSNKDWVNIININDWKRPPRVKNNNIIRVGRHSRDDIVKWPETPEELLTVYPDTEPYEIYILGGGKSPKKILGKLPDNWRVFEFGEMHPKDFLAHIDVFVYFTNNDWVESFGRATLEAMAAGVPVILHPEDKKLFGEAAIYAEPDEVSQKVDQLMHNERLYNSQVKKAWNYVDLHFGYSKHISRIKSF